MELKPQDVTKHKQEALNDMDEYLTQCINLDFQHLKKANLISYWLRTYNQYLQEEENFDSSKLKSYSHGDVIKANLGFNIGNEEGGLHYCVVLDKRNSKSYSTLTVVPLTSVKENSKIHSTSVPLGNEIYKNILEKASQILSSINKKLVSDMEDHIAKTECVIAKFENDINSINIDEIKKLHVSEEDKTQFHKECVKIRETEKIINELEQMKKLGSIALVNQITTISKQRIYDPKNDFDILAGIKISDDKMALIDEKIKKLFLN